MKNKELFNGNIFNYDNSNLLNYSYPKIDFRNKKQLIDYIEGHFTYYNSLDHHYNTFANNCKIHKIKTKLQNKNILYDVYNEELLFDDFYYLIFEDYNKDFAKFTNLRIGFCGRSAGYFCLFENDKSKFKPINLEYYTGYYNLEELEFSQIKSIAEDLLLFDFFCNEIINDFIDFCESNKVLYVSVNDENLDIIRHNIKEFIQSNNIQELDKLLIHPQLKDNKLTVNFVTNQDDINKVLNGSEDYFHYIDLTETNLIDFTNKSNKINELLNFVAFNLDSIMILKYLG